MSTRYTLLACSLLLFCLNSTVQAQSTGTTTETSTVGTTSSTATETATATTTPKDTTMRVVCFGDSITQGYSGNTSTAYPTYLPSLIDPTAFTVINSGKGGEATYNGVSRIEDVLAKHQPKYIIIMEGANDIIQGISPAATSFNLDNMAKKAQAAGAIPIMSTITPNSEPSHAPDNYNPLIITAATNGAYTLVDTYSRLITDWKNVTIDGLHPTRAGAQLIATGFAEQLKAAKQAEDNAASDSGGSGCFIATAAYGSALEPQVLLLRKFRDLRLLTNRPGQAFVAWYYQHSPSAAAYIAHHQLLRLTVQLALLPVLAAAWLLVEASLFQHMLLLLAAFSLLAIVRRSRRA